MSSDIAAKRDAWQRPMHALASRLNQSFSSHMANMHCAGEVALVVDETDFSKFALVFCCRSVIVVDRVCMQVSNANQGAVSRKLGHAGAVGQRALGWRALGVDHALPDLAARSDQRAHAARFRLFACQRNIGFAQCPFRLVDEINQGMDPRNERNVFEQIVGAASRPGVPQYWLITPKMLPGLTYNVATTVLCVYNGPWQLPQSEYDFDAFIEAAGRERTKRKRAAAASQASQAATQLDAGQ